MSRSRPLDKGDDVLNYTLTHPPLLAALALAGHGSKILIADGNFPYASVRSANADVIHLNLRPGLLNINEVLETAMDATNFESAVLMQPADLSPVAAHEDYRRILGGEFPFDFVDRFGFYEQVRSPDVSLIIATGDERLYANIIVTIGLASST